MTIALMVFCVLTNGDNWPQLDGSNDTRLRAGIFFRLPIPAQKSSDLLDEYRMLYDRSLRTQERAEELMRQLEESRKVTDRLWQRYSEFEKEAKRIEIMEALKKMRLPVFAY